jgi:hypothetical protein
MVAASKSLQGGRCRQSQANHTMMTCVTNQSHRLTSLKLNLALHAATTFVCLAARRGGSALTQAQAERAVNNALAAIRHWMWARKTPKTGFRACHDEASCRMS